MLGIDQRYFIYTEIYTYIHLQNIMFEHDNHAKDQNTYKIIQGLRNIILVKVTTINVPTR